MAPKKSTAKGKPATKKATKPRTPKQGPKLIRNLLTVPQHFRLQGNREKPFRIELKPRGSHGDCVWVPLECQADIAFLSGLDRQFEIITEAEFQKHRETYPPVGYQGNRVMLPNQHGQLQEQSVRITRDRDQVRNVVQDPYAAAAAEGNNRPTRPVGPAMSNLPGSDTALHGQMNDARQAPQAPVNPQSNEAVMAQLQAKPVTIKRTRG